MEAETVNAVTKFIIRDVAQVGEHIEKQFFLIKTEAMQRCTPREKGCGHLRL